MDKKLKCPICGSENVSNLLELNCGNLDNSTLYQFARINACEKCGHVFNNLSYEEIGGLMKYYNEEYAPTNIGSTDKTGDRPGSKNKNTMGRYDQLYNLLSNYLQSETKVLDIGCAMGGFLDYLSAKGIKNLSGIDPIKKYVDYAKEKGKYAIEYGSVEKIPFADKSFDILVMDQVLEHLVEPKKAFSEAKRVLNQNGLLCLGIPDAARYDSFYFFDFFWFIMREHIQHFDIEHLKLIAEQEGFELVTFSNSEIPMMSEKMILPNLNVIFRLTEKKSEFNITQNCFDLKKETEKYIANDLRRLDKKTKIISDLIKAKIPLYIWGIGREFLYLYESAGLKECNIADLIDANPYKQATFQVGGKKIRDKSVLSDASSDSVIIITAIAHIAPIKNALKEINFKGKILDL